MEMVASFISFRNDLRSGSPQAELAIDKRLKSRQYPVFSTSGGVTDEESRRHHPGPLRLDPFPR
jgi:hypothetical protein